MDEIKRLLELRNRIKSRKPEFIRQDTDIRIRVRNNSKWRKPKGIHSTMRHHRMGKRKLPSPGYGAPAKVRGFHALGLKPMIVENESQIPESREYGVIISGKVGMRKKAAIIKRANEKGINILNINAEDFMKNLEKFFSSKTKKISTVKEQKKESKEKVAPLEETLPRSEDDKKKEEKREKDRILTKKA